MVMIIYRFDEANDVFEVHNLINTFFERKIIHR